MAQARIFEHLQTKLAEAQKQKKTDETTSLSPGVVEGLGVAKAFNRGKLCGKIELLQSLLIDFQ